MKMTRAELLNLILSDATALSHAKAGNDAACAARCVALAQPVVVQARLTKQGLYATIGFTRGKQVILAFKGMAASTNPETKNTGEEILSLLEPRGGDHDGVDLSHPDTATMLTQFVSMSILTSAEADALLAPTRVPESISASDVSDAVASRRQNGMVGEANWIA